MRSKILFVLFSAILLNFTLGVYFHRDQYLTKYNPKYWHDRYLQSQWVTPDSKEPIGDDGLYAYAGWQYIHGADPSLLNPEMPPLGKYIIGATIIFFGNQNIQALLFGIAVLILIYHLARLFLSRTLSIFAVYLFSLEPIFSEQLSISLLDLQELFFLLASLSFFLTFLKSKKRITLFFSLIFLGAMMAVKFFVVALLLGVTYFLALIVLREKKAILNLFFLAPTTLLVYFFSYVGYFLNGHDLKEFLAFQKWILVFYKNSLAFAFPGGPFWMMLFNRWESWFGGLWYRDHIIISAPGWQITWPIMLLLSFGFFIQLLKKANFQKGILNQCRFTSMLWITVYFIFLSLTPIFPRYLLLAVPIMYISSLDFLFNLGFLKSSWLFLKKELTGYGKDYLYLFTFSFIILLWKIPQINAGNFIFSPKFARDLSLAKNIMFGLTPLNEPSLLEVFKSLFLSIFYFVADGKPQTLNIFLISASVIVATFFYYRFRKRIKKFTPFLIFPILFCFLISYQLVWEIPIFSSFGSKEFLFKNEKEVVDFAFQDSDDRWFTILPLHADFTFDSYRFLYEWYGTRQYYGRNLPPEDSRAEVIYVIIEPSDEINEADRQEIASNYKVNFKFDQKFPFGVTVWRFDKLKNPKKD